MTDRGLLCDGGVRDTPPALQSVPADAFVLPADADKLPMLVDARCVVVRSGGRIGVVLAVERHALLVVRIPTDAFVSPARREQCVALDRARRVVMIAGIGVVETVHRRVRALPVPSSQNPRSSNRHLRACRARLRWPCRSARRYGDYRGVAWTRSHRIVTALTPIR